MQRALVGRKIATAEVVPDEIVLKGVPADVVRNVLEGSTVTAVGRHGKYWWLELDRAPWLFGHLGMAGWIRDVSPNGSEHTVETRLREHGSMPLEDENGRPRFLKLLLETEDGRRIAFTDGRRLGRLWLAESRETGLNGLGPDVFDEPWTVAALSEHLKGRTAPIKALLLDQSLFAGVGNWIADEVLFQARIAPKRLAGTLKKAEIQRLVDSLKPILELAIEVDANSERFPDTWLFNSRWGGAKGTGEIMGHPIVRETVGGRTTAWVPDLQK
jgi:formamidopyrimidine-DNA glycosylase